MTFSHIRPHDSIADVLIADLRAFKDERGQFTETFRAAWFPQVSWDRLQMNRSESIAGVVRGLHYHFHQVDYWHVLKGTIRVGLADLRPNSPSFMQSATLELSADTHQGLYIPVGVAHGFAAVTDCMLTYIVNNYYDASDEHGVAWDDSDLAVNWNVAAVMLSPRDQQNRRWADISAEERPR